MWGWWGRRQHGPQEGWQLLTDSHTHFPNSPANLFLGIYPQQGTLCLSTILSVNIYHTFTCNYTKLENPAISHQSVSDEPMLTHSQHSTTAADTHANTGQAQETDGDTRSYKSSFYIVLCQATETETSSGAECEVLLGRWKCHRCLCVHENPQTYALQINLAEFVLQCIWRM